MTEPMLSTEFERWLAAELQRHAATADDPRSAAAVAQDALRGRQRQSPAARRRRWAPLLGIAAALLLPAGLLVVGSVQAPSQRMDPAPATSAWDAVLVRPTQGDPGTDQDTIEVVTVAADGSERVIRAFASEDIPVPDEWLTARATGGALASEDGWIALELEASRPSQGGTGTSPGRSRDRSSWWALADLRDAGRPTRLVPYGRYDADAAASAAWAPGGRFATTCPPDGEAPCAFARVPELGVQIVDAATGEPTVMWGVALPGRSGQDPITWAADGSGLLTVADRLTTDELRRISDEREAAGIPDLGWWPGIDPIGGPGMKPWEELPRPLGVPKLAPRSGPRWIVEGGTSIDMVSSLVTAPDGTPTTWGAWPPEGTRVRQASLSADGRAAWLLLAEASDSPRWLALARALAPGAIEVLSNAASIWRPSAGDGSFAGLAPDDSVVVLSLVTDWSPRGAKVVLVPTGGGATSIHSGRFAGFVPRDSLEEARP